MEKAVTTLLWAGDIPAKPDHPAKTIGWSDVRLMLGQRRLQRTNKRRVDVSCLLGTSRQIHKMSDYC